MKKAIVNGRIIVDNQVLEGQALLFDDRIIGLCPVAELPTECTTTDVGGAYVMPGFFDIHVHGMGGYDTMDATPEALAVISKEMVRYGVTSFLATTVTDDIALTKRALDNIRQHRASVNGAKCHGVHLEGPFINVKMKGAHNEAFIIPPDVTIFEADADVIRLVTYAPELDPEDHMIAWSKRTGVRLSLGHSNATYQEALSAFNKGVHSVTHVFNAMRGLHHREPGVVGAVLNSDVYTELIADTIHVNPALFQTLFKHKGNKRLMLVTDCMRAGGLKPGEYMLGTLKVVVDHEKATLPDGTLAGSILTMNHALKHFATQASQSISEVSPMVGENQAALLGIEGIGALKPGFWADICVLSDKFEVLQTYVNGEPKL